MNNDQSTESPNKPDGCGHCAPATGSAGEAVASGLAINGVRWIGVGIVGTNKAIALCGYEHGPDHAESMANAQRIADLWNANPPPNSELRDPERGSL